jgi:hypothetical protein
MKTDNDKLHATYALTTEFSYGTSERGRDCGCITRNDGVGIRYCDAHHQSHSMRGLPVKRGGL